MSIEEFETKLAVYGPDLVLWPDTERQAAEALLAGSVPARQMLDLEALLKRELGGKGISAPEGLVDRIVAKALDSRPRKPKP
ncbi:MAG: hypothetical protein KKH72_02040 [Alphaproteobacteria bacterium]|nr:hypothetical protein [Alphaproteobacteria bacterium]